MDSSHFPSGLSDEAVPKSTILAVDDVRTNLELYSRVLKRLPGLRVVSYTAPTSALSWARQNEFDLLLVDYRMPDLNGLQFVEQLRRIPGRDVPIVMITAVDEKDVRREAAALGVNDFLIKPIDALEFLIRVKNLLLLRARGRYLNDRAAWLADESDRAREDVGAREGALVEVLRRLTGVRDPSGVEHVTRVAEYARCVANALGVAPDEAESIAFAAVFHDIGKIAIPQSILLKPEALTPQERQTVQEHVTIGYDILHGAASPHLELAAAIARSHHERWDGGGYPDGTAGDETPLAARIVALCDVYDALISAKPYKPAWTVIEAAEYIEQQSGAQFDPEVVSAFKAIVLDLMDLRHQRTEAAAR